MEPTINTIFDITHPDYTEMLPLWQKFRKTMIGGRAYVETYLKQKSSREDALDYKDRMEMSYCPAIASSCILEIKNTIVQHFCEISRITSVKSYNDAVLGNNFGVDRLGSTMNSFMSEEVLEELLSMGKVGVWIDKQELPTNPTLEQSSKARPYLYIFKAEDIRCWTDDNSDNPDSFSKVLLREHRTVNDNQYDLPYKVVTGYRLIERNDNKTFTVKFFNEIGEQIDKEGNKSELSYMIPINLMPFHVLSIKRSLLNNVADYQSGLMQLESCDLKYAYDSNFPFLTKQIDPRWEDVYSKTPNKPKAGNSDSVKNFIDKELILNPSYGMNYPVGTNTPAFINPSSEPLKISMEKQKQIKEEIREILNLTLTSLSSPKQEKDDRQQTREAGLCAIALELERAERQIAKIWAAYENNKDEVAIKYPETFSLKTDAERRTEAKETNEMKSAIPSLTFQKEIGKRVATIMLKGIVASEVLEKIYKEIDNAKTMTSNCEEIAKDQEGGLVSDATASIARGYPEGEVVQAQKDHAARIARIQEAQTSNMAARGVNDMSTNPKGASQEKQVTKLDPSGLVDNNKVRGEGQ